MVRGTAGLSGSPLARYGVRSLRWQAADGTARLQSLDKLEKWNGWKNKQIKHRPHPLSRVYQTDSSAPITIKTDRIAGQPVGLLVYGVSVILFCSMGFGPSRPEA